MSLKKTTTLASSLGVVVLILLTMMINLRSPISITRPFYELFSTSFAHPNFNYNGTLISGFQFFYLIHETSVSCQRLFSAGGISCKKYDEAAKQICLEEAFLPPVRNCTILSFGIDDDLRFEDEMLMAFECRNYIFDPSVLFVKGQDEEIFSNEETYYPIGFHNESINVDALKRILTRLSLETEMIHLVKIDVWGQEWEVLKVLLDLGLVEVIQQLTFSSHLNFLKNLDSAVWRDTLQNLMDVLTQIELTGMKKVLYEETRNILSSILFPGDDIPRPSCGRFLYLRH